MGMSVWAASGIVAFFIARIVPLGRGRAWLAELAGAILAALACGVLATALDFGGYNEPEWRAALFAFFGASTIVALIRGITLSR